MCLSMAIFVSTVLSATTTLEAMAAQKPLQVNEISAVEATTMPAMTTSKLSQARRVGLLPISTAVKRAVKKGSAAFTVWVKEIWTSDTEMFEKSMPLQCSTAKPMSFK
mmetsp:Transcript_7770/g.13427  ORF Transcript_7770/g.13427 Transcript_7770/m.13427 type:complete len:108 (-) Transcript_7770:623-946(-)